MIGFSVCGQIHQQKLFNSKIASENSPPLLVIMESNFIIQLSFFSMKCSSSDFTVCGKIDMTMICILWCVMMNFENDKFSPKISKLHVSTHSPSRGRDVAVYVFDINQPSLPTPFYSVLVSVSFLWPFQLYFIP